MARALMVTATLALVAGVVIFGLGWRAREALDPRAVHGCAIEKHVDGEVVRYDLIRDGRVAASVSGSLDLVCDPPRLALLDGDLYVETCRGPGVIGDDLVYRRLPARPDGWWARQVFDGGTRLFALGAAFALVGLMGVAIAGATLRPA